MATWKLAVDTGQVSGSHSDMPLVVIPSDLEIGSITSAEADSSRFYTDSGLVTEVAREVVSADEIHFLGSSVTTSSEFWMDFDGVRSDYGVTTTYGRNNVWSGYTAVYHLAEATGTAAIDSTGNYNGTYGGSLPTRTAGPLGYAQNLDGTGDEMEVTSNLGFSNNQPFCYHGWFRADSSGANLNSSGLATHLFGSNGGRRAINWSSDNKIGFGFWDGSFSTIEGSALSLSTWYHVVGQFDGSSANIYIDGSSYASGSDGYIEHTGDNDFGISGRTTDFDGLVAEVRLIKDTVSSDWITTEYNNQNDNAAFWIATDVGGGGPTPTFVPIVSMVT